MYTGMKRRSQSGRNLRKAHSREEQIASANALRWESRGFEEHRGGGWIEWSE